MKRKIILCLITLCATLAIPQSIFPITILYSMKIRRIFQGSQERTGQYKKMKWVFTAVPVVFTRSRHFESCNPLVDIREKRLLLGSVFDLRCTLYDKIWVEFTTAFSNERAKARGISEDPLVPLHCRISKTGFDDITIAAGRNFFAGEKSQIVFYGIAGFPTSMNLSRDDALGTFNGTHFFSLGAGGEFSYSFIEGLERTFLMTFQARCIHFFDRSWDPVLPCGSTIQPGELVDFLGALRFREKREIFEVGYNPTLFFNQAIQLPDQCKTRTDTFVQNGAYINYSHIFRGPNNPIVVGAGFGFNHADFLVTRIYTGWINASYVF